ncbi:hypothetical protein K0B96_11755 [Horticoccus luteus]|uniref:Uncharacterized protein n=1 Tax=Horticoccus luteus TaxID=2862869 RepID=A0A8F9TS27_9BACT|nr:hypothetical protein [Horticoccus luteus]QYM77985.1 hypothetical protein K0B96_11755 [Horticoccus luteus]
MSRERDDDLRRLHFINALFASVTGHDLYLAQQIKAAITFSLGELETQVATQPELAAQFDSAFNAAAARLLSTFFAGQPDHGFVHWDAARTLTSATPLFARAELLAALKTLAPFSHSTLLITNLRPALIPPEKRATARRLQDYDDALAFIRQFAAARVTRHANLQLLFL